MKSKVVLAGFIGILVGIMAVMLGFYLSVQYGGIAFWLALLEGPIIPIFWAPIHLGSGIDLIATPILYSIYAVTWYKKKKNLGLWLYAIHLISAVGVAIFELLNPYTTGVVKAWFSPVGLLVLGGFCLVSYFYLSRFFSETQYVRGGSDFRA